MKRMKSAWEFGDLFDDKSARQVFTVSEITTAVKRLLEREWPSLWIRGEITNLRLQSSGHAYFSLKDPSAQIQCVLFRGEAASFDRSLLADGQSVILGGALTVYEVRGQYQMRVTAVELAGVGALQVAFEKLKRKLEAEGLFATERKRPVPRLPRCIGIVTSPTGAALRDVIHVVARRAPGLELILAPCRVQGTGAAEELARAIEKLNEFAESGSPAAPDLILITRGGGSLEDLWAFNEELLARAISKSKLPIVSAVGHEIDFTISDFVADLRAATPSAAAEMISEGWFGSREFVAEAASRLRDIAQARLEATRGSIAQIQHRLTLLHPRRRLDTQAQRLDDAQSSLARSARTSIKIRGAAWHSIATRLAQVRPALVVQRRGKELHQHSAQLAHFARHRFRILTTRFEGIRVRLELLSPRNVLQRGYSITLDPETGKVIRSAEEVQRGQRIKTRFKTGEIRSVVETTKTEEDLAAER